MRIIYSYSHIAFRINKITFYMFFGPTRAPLCKCVPKRCLYFNIPRENGASRMCAGRGHGLSRPENSRVRHVLCSARFGFFLFALLRMCYSLFRLRDTAVWLAGCSSAIRFGFNSILELRIYDLFCWN